MAFDVRSTCRVARPWRARRHSTGGRPASVHRDIQTSTWTSIRSASREQVGETLTGISHERRASPGRGTSGQVDVRPRPRASSSATRGRRWRRDEDVDLVGRPDAGGIGRVLKPRRAPRAHAHPSFCSAECDETYRCSIALRAWPAASRMPAVRRPKARDHAVSVFHRLWTFDARGGCAPAGAGAVVPARACATLQPRRFGWNVQSPRQRAR